MTATAKALFDLNATDLMSAVPMTLPGGMPLRRAAEERARAEVHGAPVVDSFGRCIGVLSESDLARWAVRRDGLVPSAPRTCSHQKRYRGVGGQEGVLCILPAGRCSCHTPTDLPDGFHVQVCREPNCVALEWQMVEMQMLPAEDVRGYMTGEPVPVGPGARIRDIARRMLEARVRRVIVTDPVGRPIGVVSASDLVAAVATGVEAAAD